LRRRSEAYPRDVETAVNPKKLQIFIIVAFFFGFL